MTQLLDDEVLKQIPNKEPREEKTSSNNEFINKPREEKHHQTTKIHQTKDPELRTAASVALGLGRSGFVDFGT